MFACHVFLGVQVSDQINSPYYYINYFNKKLLKQLND
jgi:hypothetical protein